MTSSFCARMWVLLVLAPLAAACGSPARPQEPTAETTVPIPSAQPVASVELAASPSSPPPPSVSPVATSTPASPTSGLRASTAMPMEGNVVAEKLVAEVNRQIAPMGRCAELIRKTDMVVGSLNLQVMVSKDGHVTPALQSPVNPEAEKCILDGIRSWSIAGAGHGRAMVLLVLQNAAGK